MYLGFTTQGGFEGPFLGKVPHYKKKEVLNPRSTIPSKPSTSTDTQSPICPTSQRHNEYFGILFETYFDLI